MKIPISKYNSHLKLLLLITAIVVMLPSYLKSQTFSFRNYTVKDGLPSSEVYHSIQDSKGYIWFATNHGVSRFNGYEFQNFTIDNGLPDNTVFDLFEDHTGKIWFLPISLELSYFYKDSIYIYEYNDSIHKYISKAADHPLKNAFYVDSVNSVYFSMVGNPSIIQIKSDGKTSYMSHLGNKNSGVLLVEEFPIFYHSSRHDSSFNNNNLNLSPIPIYDTLSNYYVGHMSSTNEILFTHGRLLNIINTNKKTISIQCAEHIYWISQDSDEGYWIGTRNGFFYKKNRSDKWFDKKHLDGIAVSSVFEDREKNMWLTTLSEGVFLIPNKEINVFKKEHGLLHNHTNLLSIINDNLIISYRSNGLSRMSLDSISLTSTIKENIREVYSLYSHDAANPYIYFSNNYGLFKTKYPYRDLHAIPIAKRIYPSHTYVRAIGNCKALIHDDVDLWYGTKDYLYKAINNASVGIAHYDRIYDLHMLNSKMYIGTLKGLHSIKGEDRSYLGIHHELLQSRINDIEEINDTYLLLATKGNGLLIYNTVTNEVSQITTQDGILSNSLNKVTSNDSDLIWIASNNGVSKIQLNFGANPEVIKIENISDYNGLPAAEVNDIKYWSEHIILSTSDGLAKYNINKIKPNKHPPKVMIESLKNGNQEISLVNDYKFKYNKSSLSIKFAGLSFKQAGNLLYKYRMIGIDTLWIETKDQTIQYASLPPGDYIFEVIAQNEDGVWSTEPARVNFNIIPPIYSTGWFLTLLTLFASSILFVIYKYRVNEINKKNKLLLTITNYKQQILRQQMNPHFMFNTLNSIQYYLLEEDIDSSLDYLSQFARLMRMILENSQKKYIPIKTELDALELYLNLEVLRYEQRISFEINVAKEINEFEYKIPPLLLQPYCENAIIHGLANKEDGGNLTILLFQENNKIVCTIEDSGIGRLKAKLLDSNNNTTVKHKSLGTEISTNRIKILNELYGDDIKIDIIDLDDDEGMPSGTRIEIILPIITNHEL